MKKWNMRDQDVTEKALKKFAFLAGKNKILVNIYSILFMS